MRKKALFLMIVGSLLVVALSFAQEKITITTYYPSPYGSYRELRAQRMVVGGTNDEFCWEGSCAADRKINAEVDLLVTGKVAIGAAGNEPRSISVPDGSGGTKQVLATLDVNSPGRGPGNSVVAIGGREVDENGVVMNKPAIVLNRGDGCVLCDNGASDIFFSANGSIASEIGMYFFIDAFNTHPDGRVAFSFRKNGETKPATDDAQELMRIEESGKVGIGESTPHENLEIASLTDGNSGRLIVSDGEGADRRVVLLEAPTVTQDYGRILAHKYGDSAAGKDLVMQDTGGNVGIGTVPGNHGSEDVKLDVNGYAATDDLWMKNPKNGSARWASQGPTVSFYGGQNGYLQNGQAVNLGSHDVCFLGGMDTGASGCSASSAVCNVYTNNNRWYLLPSHGECAAGHCWVTCLDW
jgi:hypothetical protein